MMASSRTGLSVVLTLGIMLSLGVIGAVHRGGRSLGDDGRAGLGAVGASRPSVAEPAANPLDEPPKAEWDVLTGCEVVENRTNAAHHFHVKRGDHVYVFELYFTAAPECAPGEPEDISEQARYFGLASQLPEAKWEKALEALGEEAWRHVSALLADRPFRIFTRWEKRPDTHHYYAFVHVEDERGERKFLQEWLAESGYALVREPALKALPDGTLGSDFLEHLRVLQHRAQFAHSGAWAGVNLP